MIKYSLKCAKCKFEYDSWFASSKEFEKLKKIKLLTCENCGSLKIDKSLMAPNLSNAKKKLPNRNNAKLNEVKKKLKDYQTFVKKNFEFVGDNFVYEARSIHYDNKRNKKGIYGSASKKEVQELKDEGIETEMIPWVDEKEN